MAFKNTHILYKRFQLSQSSPKHFFSFRHVHPINKRLFEVSKFILIQISIAMVSFHFSLIRGHFAIHMFCMLIHQAVGNKNSVYWPLMQHLSVCGFNMTHTKFRSMTLLLKNFAKKLIWQKIWSFRSRLAVLYVV